MKKAIVVGAMTFAGLMNAAAPAHAEDVLEVDGDTGIPWSWYSEADCSANGPSLANNDPAFDVAYPWWFCQQGVSGLWYFYSTDVPQ